MPKIYTLDDVDVQGKRVLLRLDLNMPLQKGRFLDETRLDKSLGTLQELRTRGASVTILSHLGRPGGEVDPALSLQAVAAALSVRLGCAVTFDAPATSDTIAMWENVRFDPGEESNDPDLAARYAAGQDLFVNDAFSVSHRAHASVEAITHILPSFAGRYFAQELENLTHVRETPEKPVMAVVGGSKISSKISILERLVEQVSFLAPVGGLAHTFLQAQGIDVQRSLVESDHLSTAQRILARAALSGCQIILPTDVVVAPDLGAGATAQTCAVSEIPEGMMILDMGAVSVETLCVFLAQSRTVLWNGPLGVCEVPPFDAASRHWAQALAQNRSIFSVAGGGETVMVLRQAGVLDALSYVSTAGGAFLEFMEGRTLPGVAALERS